MNKIITIANIILQTQLKRNIQACLSITATHLNFDFQITYNNNVGVKVCPFKDNT